MACINKRVLHLRPGPASSSRASLLLTARGHLTTLAPSATGVAYSRYGDTVIVTSAPLVNIWRRLLLGLFFLSGISGLLYEVAWTRMLHLLFGDTVLAVSTVLASFMAGLALGSFWASRRVDRLPRVLPLYAGLEAGIGLSALLFPAVLQA